MVMVKPTTKNDDEKRKSPPRGVGGSGNLVGDPIRYRITMRAPRSPR